MPKYKLDCEKTKGLKIKGKRYTGGDTVELTEQEAEKLPAHLKLKKLSPGRPQGAGSVLKPKQAPPVEKKPQDAPQQKKAEGKPKEQ